MSLFWMLVECVLHNTMVLDFATLHILILSILLNHVINSTHKIYEPLSHNSFLLPPLIWSFTEAYIKYRCETNKAQSLGPNDPLVFVRIL